MFGMYGDRLYRSATDLGGNSPNCAIFPGFLGITPAHLGRSVRKQFACIAYASDLLLVTGQALQLTHSCAKVLHSVDLLRMQMIEIL
jgi:hypothetical protein